MATSKWRDEEPVTMVSATTFMHTKELFDLKYMAWNPAPLLALLHKPTFVSNANWNSVADENVVAHN